LFAEFEERNKNGNNKKMIDFFMTIDL